MQNSSNRTHQLKTFSNLTLGSLIFGRNQINLIFRNNYLLAWLGEKLMIIISNTFTDKSFSGQLNYTEYSVFELHNATLMNMEMILEVLIKEN